MSYLIREATPHLIWIAIIVLILIGTWPDENYPPRRKIQRRKK